VLLGLTGVVLVVGTATGFVFDFVAHAAPVGVAIAVALATALARTLLFGGAMLLLYSFVPAPRPPLRASTLGALASTSLLVLAMPLFSTYVSRLGRYNMIYGPVAIVIVVLVWFWVASFVVLYGAHVTSLLERQGLAGNTAPPPPPPSESEQMP
jgi:membrane protein